MLGKMTSGVQIVAVPCGCWKVLGALHNPKESLNFGPNWMVWKLQSFPTFLELPLCTCNPDQCNLSKIVMWFIKTDQLHCRRCELITCSRCECLPLLYLVLKEERRIRNVFVCCITHLLLDPGTLKGMHQWIWRSWQFYRNDLHSLTSNCSNSPVCLNDDHI